MRKADPKRIMVCVDGSEHAMAAVKYVGDILAFRDLEVVLFHVMMGMKSLQYGDPYYIPDEEVRLVDSRWLEKVKMDMRPDIEEAKRKLVNSGHSPDKIDFEFITGASSRAGTILEEVEKGGYGTIVMGRRGLSKVADFFMGRVSNKVLHMAKKPAVWIVS